MFGSAKRTAKFQEASVLECSRRPDLFSALMEARQSPTPITLRVASMEIKGSNGGCTITNDQWNHNTALAMVTFDMLQQQLKKVYAVTASAWVRVEHKSVGLKMDLARGYSNPRWHATDYKTERVDIKNRRDYERQGNHFRVVECFWITVHFR